MPIKILFEVNQPVTDILQVAVSNAENMLWSTIIRSPDTINQILPALCWRDHLRQLIEQAIKASLHRVSTDTLQLQLASDDRVIVELDSSCFHLADGVFSSLAGLSEAPTRGLAILSTLLDLLVILLLPVGTIRLRIIELIAQGIDSLRLGIALGGQIRKHSIASGDHVLFFVESLFGV